MKIALIGYGRMGHMIEEVATARGHEIVCTIDAGQEERFDSEAFRSAEVAIEFSIPTAAVANFGHCIERGMPVVSGTTGWLDSLTTVSSLVMERGARFIYGSNFSVGVNIFWAANKYLSGLMAGFPEYGCRVKEVHHTAKLDHPSGTAISTADQIIRTNPRYSKWEDCGQGEAAAEQTALRINWERTEGVPGIHEVEWRSDVDRVTLSHEAFSRRGFALGAVMAAEWIVKQPAGFYEVGDMFAELFNK